MWGSEVSDAVDHAPSSLLEDADALGLHSEVRLGLTLKNYIHYERFLYDSCFNEGEFI